MWILEDLFGREQPEPPCMDDAVFAKMGADLARYERAKAALIGLPWWHWRKWLP